MGELGMCRGNRGQYIRVSALGDLAGSFRGGFRGGTFGRQGVRRCVEGWFRGVRWFFIECRAEGYPLWLFYL